LIQERCTAPELSRAVLQWLDDPAACEQAARRFQELHHLLRQDTATRATDALAQILS
jgi:lipid-A-disaccharide synthase